MMSGGGGGGGGSSCFEATNQPSACGAAAPLRISARTSINAASRPSSQSASSAATSGSTNYWWRSSPQFATMVDALPPAYNFEIDKTLARVNKDKAKRIALQLPEGLAMFALTLADLVETFGGPQVEFAIVLGDVAYGACCVDDLNAKALGADLLVHYGHSCLVPVDCTVIPVMYVFVTIAVDVEHLVESIKLTSPVIGPSTRWALAGTVQFTHALPAARALLAAEETEDGQKAYPCMCDRRGAVPQAKPLSPGEVLGCTAPSVPNLDAFVFVADGRFHMEAMMMANPNATAFRYDPYVKEMVREEYDHTGMRQSRRHAVEEARGRLERGGTAVALFGTLGRQGNPRLVKHVVERIEEESSRARVVLMAELRPDRLKALGADVYVQVACPRLSIDWGDEVGDAPLLTPYEVEVARGHVNAWWGESPRAYPMDYYAKDAGPWGSSSAVKGGRLNAF
ncbi:2-(3-amino-3-carboxypropyl)histidine synthase subunit [Pycnococcus provasolii]